MTYLVLYTQSDKWMVAAGPYDTTDEADAAKSAIWDKMDRDASLEGVFPRGLREYDALVVTDAWRPGPGAYGKVMGYE